MEKTLAPRIDRMRTARRRVVPTSARIDARSNGRRRRPALAGIVPPVAS